MSAAPIPWKHVRNILVLFAPLWIGTTLLFGLTGAAYSLVSSDMWSARQPLLVRDEATASADRLGRFASQTELKAAQETILEMVQTPEVVAAALREVGPVDDVVKPGWPSPRLVDEVASERVNLVASQGSEFGHTEVVYLQVQEYSPQRAQRFCEAMLGNLTEHLRHVRQVRADSVVNELTHARDLVRQSLEESVERLHEIEVQFGSDLGELRNLNETISGDGTNRRALEATVSELQTAVLELERLESLHHLLAVGAGNPHKLLISGNELLSSQPSLQRLKAGLIDAQLRTSQLAGTISPTHPRRKAAVATEMEIKRRLQTESTAVTQAMAPVLKLQRQRVAQLREKKQQLTGRLEQLAQVRSKYARIDADVRNRTEQLSAAETALSEARATRSAALSTNLVADLGPPQVSDSPVGISGSLMTLGSTIAGLMFGLGTVFLVAPGTSDVRHGRRWSDYLSGGRRATDPAPPHTHQPMPTSGRPVGSPRGDQSPRANPTAPPSGSRTAKPAASPQAKPGTAPRTKQPASGRPVVPPRRDAVSPANGGSVAPSNGGPVAPTNGGPVAPSNGGPVAPTNGGPAAPGNHGPRTPTSRDHDPPAGGDRRPRS